MLQVPMDLLTSHHHHHHHHCPPVPKPVVLHADATIQRPVVVQVCEEDSYESEAASSTSSLSLDPLDPLDPLDLEEDHKSHENPDPCCDDEYRRAAHWNPKTRHMAKREAKGRRNKNVPCEDYRRFSSRSKTKTEFFGVPGQKKEKKHRKDGGSSRRWEMGKRAVAEASPHSDLKVVAGREEAKEISPGPVSSPPEGEGQPSSGEEVKEAAVVSYQMIKGCFSM